MTIFARNKQNYTHANKFTHTPRPNRFTDLLFLLRVFFPISVSESPGNSSGSSSRNNTRIHRNTKMCDGRSYAEKKRTHSQKAQRVRNTVVVISVCVISTSTNEALIRIGGATLSVSYCFTMYVLWENIFNLDIWVRISRWRSHQQTTTKEKKMKKNFTCYSNTFLLIHSLTHSFNCIAHKHTHSFSHSPKWH